VAELGKLPGPVVGTGAGLPADQAGWQMGHAFEQLGAWYRWTHQGGFASFIHAMHGEDVLGETMTRPITTVTIAMISPSRKS